MCFCFKVISKTTEGPNWKGAAPLMLRTDRGMARRDLPQDLGCIQARMRSGGELYIVQLIRYKLFKSTLSKWSDIYRWCVLVWPGSLVQHVEASVSWMKTAITATIEQCFPPWRGLNTVMDGPSEEQTHRISFNISLIKNEPTGFYTINTRYKYKESIANILSH